MRRTTQYRGVQRAYMAILGGAALVAALAAAFAATLAGASSAAINVAPENTVEPRIIGHPAGRSGSASQSWHLDRDGPDPLRVGWYRCEGAGAPDASDCTRISNASDNTYVARQGDSGLPASRPGHRSKRRRAGHGDL